MFRGRRNIFDNVRKSSENRLKSSEVGRFRKSRSLRDENLMHLTQKKLAGITFVHSLLQRKVTLSCRVRMVLGSPTSLEQITRPMIPLTTSPESFIIDARDTSHEAINVK